jgi:hypothetical protein
MREQMIQTLKQHAKANSQLHCMNIEVYLKKSSRYRRAFRYYGSNTRQKG